MPEAANHTLPGATNDSWRTWLMTGARRTPVDRRRMRGEHKGLKRMLLEGVGNGDDRPHAWTGFSGAMVRHAVDEAMRSLPAQDTQFVKLAYFGGYSNREIADRVGVTEGTVQRRLRRALASISERIQHGRAFGRRALYALAIWLSGRWVTESAHQFVQAAAVAATAAVIVAQPAPPPATPESSSAQTQSNPATLVVPPVPSPTVPARHLPARLTLPAVPAPALSLPVQAPPIPTPSPKLPV
jgi:RNA polymerase sigma factor (sigma-70 family)